MIFVASASHVQLLNGTRDMIEVVIIPVVKRFVEDIEVPIVFRRGNGTEYTSRAFDNFYKNLENRHDLTGP